MSEAAINQRTMSGGEYPYVPVDGVWVTREEAAIMKSDGFIGAGQEALRVL